MSCTTISGTCSSCVSACKAKPGWFAPGEVEKVAKFLNVSLQELFNTKLMIDWWSASEDFELEEDVFALSPAVINGNPGEEFPSNPRGKCVFLTVDNLCGIHEVKPYECRESLPCDPNEDGKHHKLAMKLWNKVEHQDQIKELLGRNPESVYFDSWSFLGL